MFVILRVNEAPKGIFKRAKQRKQLSKSQVEAVSTEKGLPFFILDIPADINDAAWNTVAEKCGRYVSRIVAPRSLALPDCGKLKRFVPSLMPSSLTFNTAADVIKKAAIDPCEISVTVTDRNAVHASGICRLLPLAAAVKVVTAHPERYASACSTALNEYGASIIIRSAYEPCTKPDIVICCDGGLAPSMQSAAVFGYRHKQAGKIYFCGSGIELARIHGKIIPDNIDPIDFAGAVTELCGSPEYKNSVFSCVETGCGICENPSPEKCLRCFVAGKL